jgi:ankyrin repeat protein
MIETLTAHGADVNAREAETGATPLHHAASWGRLDAVKALLDSGADPTLTSKAGATPLKIALANGHTEAADLLRRSKR